MRKPFKMKGYTYPGKSPVKQEKIEAIPAQEAQPLSVDTGDDEPLKPSKSYEEVSSEIKAEKATTSAKNKADKRAKRGEFWEGLAGQAGMALLETGLQIGATALTTPRSKPSRKGSDTSGFSSIQFGRRS